nr:MAG TPA: NADH-ubiquinone oxidoreductase [Caudoviricetes sp.]
MPANLAASSAAAPDASPGAERLLHAGGSLRWRQCPPCREHLRTPVF